MKQTSSVMKRHVSESHVRHAASPKLRLACWVAFGVALTLTAVACSGDSEVAITGEEPTTTGDSPSDEPTALPEPEATATTDPAEPTALPEPDPTADATALPEPDPTADATATADAGPDPDDAFPEWLRVNGFGPVDFGQDRATVEAAIEPRFGPPDSVNDLAECGAGPITALGYDDFTLNLQDDELVGWYFEGSTPQLTSPSGVTPGISRVDMESIYVGVDISDTTLGTEFFFEVPAGFMGGFLSDDGSEVAAMYAGTTCFFR